MFMSARLRKPGCELVHRRLAIAILLGLVLAATAMRSSMGSPAQPNADDAVDRGSDHGVGHYYYDPLPQEPVMRD